MDTISLLNKRRVGLIWPCVIAALGHLLVTAAWAQKAPAATNQGPTYLGDIQPIFMGHCSRCHNQQARFVYNWLDYKTAYADRWEIKRRIWDSWDGTYYKDSMPLQNSPESLLISDADRRRVKDWVLSGAPRGNPRVDTGDKTKAERIVAGRKLFMTICSACHQPTGQGLPNVFPPLAGSDFLNADKKRAIKVVINGRQGEVVVNGMKFNNSMPSFPFSDDDIANVLTYVYNSFGNSGLEVTTAEVKALRAEPPDAPTGPPPPKSIYE
jgi:mono/diheme cytochrome c family protein